MYRANTLTYTMENERQRRLNITFQVSDNNIAFRYEIPAWGDRLSCVIEREATGSNTLFSILWHTLYL